MEQNQANNSEPLNINDESANFSDSDIEGLSQKLFEQLNIDANELSKQYPNFNIANELQSQNFAKLIAAGVDMKTSYEICHAEEIKNKEIKKALDEAKQSWLNEMRANLARPTESAISDGAGNTQAIVTVNMSKAQREEIAKRAAHGESISF